VLSAEDERLAGRIAGGLAAIEGAVEDRNAFAGAVDTLLGLIERHWPNRQYHEVPPQVAAADRALIADRGERFAAQIWHAVLLRCALASLPRIGEFPPPLAERIRRQFDRLVDYAANSRYAHRIRRFPNRNVFQKDLGLARLTMLPADGRLLDIYGTLPRRQLLSDFPRTLPFYLLAYRLGGLDNYFATHMHVPMHDEWAETGSPALGFLKNICVVEQYLALMPYIRGHVASGWLSDPALEHISPHLWHAYRIPFDYGARQIELEADASVVEAALAKSKTRRALYEQGKYQPRTFIRLWGRDGLLQCAAEYRSGKLRLQDYGITDPPAVRP
jgi:hypothetical protein